jgi:hypothetical protein
VKSCGAVTKPRGGTISTPSRCTRPRLIAQLGRAVPQRREHQVRLLPVERAPPEHRLRLDHQHRLPGLVEEVRP